MEEEKKTGKAVKSVAVRSPYDCMLLLKMYAKKKVEHFGILCIDADYSVISKKVIAIGSERECHFQSRDVFFEVCRKKATAVIIFHNHPSATELFPSEDDMHLTACIQNGMEILGIQLLDHIIIGKDGYFSFAEHKILKDVRKRYKDTERQKMVAEGCRK